MKVYERKNERSAWRTAGVSDLSREDVMKFFEYRIKEGSTSEFEIESTVTRNALVRGTAGECWKAISI